MERNPQSNPQEQVNAQNKIIWGVHQGIWGVEGSDDKGLVGDVKEIKADVKNQNGRVSKVEGKIRYIYGLIVGAALAGGGIGAGIGSLLNG